MHNYTTDTDIPRMSENSDNENMVTTRSNTIVRISVFFEIYKSF